MFPDSTNADIKTLHKAKTWQFVYFKQSNASLELNKIFQPIPEANVFATSLFGAVTKAIE